MKLQELDTYCKNLANSTADFPFDRETLCYKTRGKIFAICNIEHFTSISLKCDPDDGLYLRSVYPAVEPGYHLNKRHWISVHVDGTIPDHLLFSWILDSYYLVKRGLPKALRAPAPGIEIPSAEDYIKKNGGDLEKALFEFSFGKGDARPVEEALMGFQNSDGGFGHGLEPDFLLPESSPIATAEALKIYREIGIDDSPGLRSLLHYLEEQYNPEREGWYAVGEEVNKHPHAPWWNWRPESANTWIDDYWGNPSAEIIALLLPHEEKLERLAVGKMAENAVQRFATIDSYESVHEIFCYISLYHSLEEELRKPMDMGLSRAVQELCELNPEAWKEYTPRPLDFTADPGSPLFPMIAPYIQQQCDFLLSTVEKGIWQPHWDWAGNYPEAWEQSKKRWSARITRQNYLLLHRFGYL